MRGDGEGKEGEMSWMVGCYEGVREVKGGGVCKG